MSEIRYWEKSITSVPHSCGDGRCSVTEKITKTVGIFFIEDYQHNTIAYASVNVDGANVQGQVHAFANLFASDGSVSFSLPGPAIDKHEFSATVPEGCEFDCEVIADFEVGSTLDGFCSSGSDDQAHGAVSLNVDGDKSDRPLDMQPTPDPGQADTTATI